MCDILSAGPRGYSRFKCVISSPLRRRGYCRFDILNKTLKYQTCDILSFPGERISYIETCNILSVQRRGYHRFEILWITKKVVSSPSSGEDNGSFAKRQRTVILSAGRRGYHVLLSSYPQLLKSHKCIGLFFPLLFPSPLNQVT